MNLKNKSDENIIYMIEAIKEKLKVVNANAIKGEAFRLEHYEEIYDIYQLVTTKEHLSIREIEAIISELRSMRK